MNKLIILGGIAAAAFMTSCSSTRTMATDDLSGEWNVTEIQGKPFTLSEGVENPYLAFDIVNGRIFGLVSCNRIMGNVYAGADGSMELSGIAATKMMCPDQQLEMNILTALNQVKRYGADKEGDLVLMDGHNHHMLTLERRPDAITPTSLVGTWKINLLGNLDLSLNEGEDVYTIQFDNDGQFSMTTGCNNVGGNYSGRYVDISFTNLMSTRMMCPNMEVETVAQNVLPTITSFSELAQEGMIGFYDASNNMVMVIEKISN